MKRILPITARAVGVSSPSPVSLRLGRALVALVAGLAVTWPSVSPAQPAAEAAAPSKSQKLSAESKAALQRLYAANPQAKELGAKSKAILVFPRIVKAGLMVGGQSGDGALIVKGSTVGFYNITAGTFGFQAGAQTFSYALFFITDSAIDYVKKSKGWSVGSGPSVVVIDQGKAKSINTTTLKDDVYAIPFGQQGLMAGLGLEGSKITRIYPES